MTRSSLRALLVRFVVLVLVVVSAMPSARAEDPASSGASADVGASTGTLATIRSRGSLQWGVRMSARIMVDGRVKRHGDNEVIRGISLSLRKGQVDAIIGPSEGGKSTFLRCLNGLERFQGGTVHIKTHTLTPTTDPVREVKLLESVRRTLGFVFQQFNLFPHLSVLDNLYEAPALMLGEPRESAVLRARALLDRVGLSHRVEAFPRDLSGGQQQRVAIARTLMMHVFAGGHDVEHGPPEQVFGAPQHEITKSFLREVGGAVAT